MGKPTELVQGTLDMLVLKALTRGSLHGYAVADWIRATSKDVLRVQEGALYPALHRLELHGMLTSEWSVSDKGRRAKFYSLTAEGRKHLAAEAQSWHELAGAIALVMRTA
jgi:PadR family transcriptional regulator, regulatory protein PadR